MVLTGFAGKHMHLGVAKQPGQELRELLPRPGAEDSSSGGADGDQVRTFATSFTIGFLRLWLAEHVCCRGWALKT